MCNAADRECLSGRLPKPYTIESADWWYKNVVSEDGKTGIFRAILVDGKVVGNITIELKFDIYQKDVELGCLLDRVYENKGIMTEAVCQMCKIAFKELDIERITGYVFSANQASQKVLLKNDFELEGVLKRAIYKDKKIYDLHIYGKCKNNI